MSPNRFQYEEIAQDYLIRKNAELGVQPDWYYLFKLWEESGEVPREYLRWQGLHRSGRTTQDNFSRELADVVIIAFAVAHLYAIDLDAVIQQKHTVVMRQERAEAEEGIA